MKTLLLSPRVSEESTRMKAAALDAGWQVIQSPRWGEFPDRMSDAYYGESLYGRLMEQEGRIQGALAVPPEGWLPSLPEHLLQREVRLLKLGQVRRKWGDKALFCKPVDEKTFPARPYPGPDALPFYLGSDEKVLVATPVVWASEYRVFVLDGHAQTVSRYAKFGQEDIGWDKHCLRAGDVAEEAYLAGPELPSGVVIDVGKIGRTWAVVEANPAWTSGLYSCKEALALPVVAASIEAC